MSEFFRPDTEDLEPGYARLRFIINDPRFQPAPGEDGSMQMIYSLPYKVTDEGPTTDIALAMDRAKAGALKLSPFLCLEEYK